MLFRSTSAVQKLGSAQVVQTEFKKVDDSMDVRKWKLMEIFLLVSTILLPSSLGVVVFKRASFIDMTAAQELSSLAGVAALSGAVLALAATALLARMLRSGSGLWIGLLAALVAVSASSAHYLARPHVFSILFYTLALWILAEDRLRQIGRAHV